MEIITSPSTMHCEAYGVHRWWSHGGYNLHGAYLLVCLNVELYKMQDNFAPHVVCIVDDFGNLVRKP